MAAAPGRYGEMAGPCGGRAAAGLVDRPSGFVSFPRPPHEKLLPHQWWPEAVRLPGRGQKCLGGKRCPDYLASRQARDL